MLKKKQERSDCPENINKHVLRSRSRGITFYLSLIRSGFDSAFLINLNRPGLTGHSAIELTDTAISNDVVLMVNYVPDDVPSHPHVPE